MRFMPIAAGTFFALYGQVAGQYYILSYLHLGDPSVNCQL